MRKFLALSEQDHKLLLHLHQFIYLSREFIDTYIYNNDEEGKSTSAHEKSVYRRLKQLKDAGYITSFAVPISSGSGRPSNIYTLDEFGVETIEQLTGNRHWNFRWSKSPQIWYLHTLALAEVVKSFEKHAPASLVVKEFISEAKAHFKYYGKAENDTKPQSHYLRPDGILVIGHPDHDEKNFGYMLEMERSYAERSATIRKLRQYNHFFGKSIDDSYENRMRQFDEKVGFDVPVATWKILFIGNNDSMGGRILRQLEGLTSEVTLLAASKEDLLENPYRKVYRSLDNPDTPTAP